MALTRLPKNAFATGSVDASKIEDGTIQAVEVSGTLSADKLNATQNLSSKTVTLPNTSVTNDMLAGSIANAKLSNSSITINGTSVSLGASASVGVDVNWQSVITADGSTATTGVAGNGYFIDTTSNAHTFNLPASATLGDQIAIKDYAGTFNTNNLTIGRNGHNIQGVANNSLITTNRASLLLVYVDTTKGWLYAEESNVADLQLNTFIAATGGTVTESGDFKIHSFTGDGCFVVTQLGAGASGGPSNVDYLVIAGGASGGSGRGGGGGAGGYRTTFPSPGCNAGAFPISATTYPITVGGGGASPSNGSDSIFSTITSTGGGRGTGLAGDGIPGGSGGGGGAFGGAFGGPKVGGTGNTPPVSPPQGNNGGDGNPTNWPSIPNGKGLTGGGGGGAGAAGNSVGPSNANGGAGASNSITGSSVTRAGGGGGSNCTPIVPGTGGPGGGGNGNPAGTGCAGNANTGSGGGGNGQDGGSGGAGGSGIVIIRYKFQ